MDRTDPKSFSAVTLKEALKRRGLSTAGTKAELINRLTNDDPSGGWMQTISTRVEETVNLASGNDDGAHGRSSYENEEMRQSREELDDQREPQLNRREIEIYRREKELAERELALARREIELLRLMQSGGTNVLTGASSGDTPGKNQTPRGASSMNRRSVNEEDDFLIRPTRVNVNAVADLLSHFNGDAEIFETWEKQVKFLRAAYRLNDELTKILIGMRLKGRVSEWFHSKPEYIEMTPDAILDGLRGMFYHRPNKIIMRRRFEERSWKKSETFYDYVHEKTIMANRIDIPNDEILRYIVDGIPDPNLRDLARVQGFTTMDGILQAFEEISLKDRVYPASAASTKDGDSGKRKNDKGSKSAVCEKGMSSDGRDRGITRRCFSCGSKDHVSSNCPTREKGVKCFGCNGYGHIASRCPNRNETKNSCAIIQSYRQKRLKNVLVNDVAMEAIIDSGSDITIMREDEYVKLGSPRFELEAMPFRGIGTEENVANGGFYARLTVDRNCYEIPIYVVADNLTKYKLLIGNDFLDTVNVNLERGNPTIVKPADYASDGREFVEICQINIISDRESHVADVSHIRSAEHRRIVQSLISDYKPNQTREIGIEMKLVLKDDEPVYLRPRRLGVAERTEVNAQIDEWLKNGIVRPSVSDYASPVVLAKKRDGTNRLCVDYRLLNKKIIKDRYPLPLIEDQLDALQGARVFSTLDLKNGFFHVKMDKSSMKYTAFIVPDGHYEFLRVPFGLCNSPAVFQKFVNAVFRDLIRDKVVLVYMDDLIIPSIDFESALRKLKRVLDVASQHGLIINWKKCNLLRTGVEYLGHIVEGGKIRPSEHKTEAVKKFPMPASVRQVQSFLGLTGYFRKFVPGYSTIARPLTNLLKAAATFRFEKEEKDAFEQLKLILINKPVLSLYKVDAETELHTDASMHGYGAILLQRDSEDHAMHPIYYASGKTTPAEERYPSYELEVLAIIKALKKFRVYLLGINFKIVTDCRAFTQTMSKKDLCIRVARWALLLEEFHYEIEHRPGRSMFHVDALSRNPLPVCLLLEESDGGLTARLKKAQHDDVDTKKTIQLTNEGQTHGYVIRGGLLFKEVDNDIRLVVPKVMCSQIIRRAHEKGHFSVAKTEAIVKRDYYIQNLRPKVEKIVHNCINCILAEKKQGKQEGFLFPIDKGEVPLDTFHVDHLGPLATTRKSYKYIFVVTDSFCKFTWLYATKSTATAEVLNSLRKQATIFGNPRRIISDRGTAFTSGAFEEYCKSEGIQHVLTTTGVPRANGQVERINRTLIPLLTKLAAPRPEEWHKYLRSAQQYLNATVHRSIATTPFHLLFGTHARSREDDNVRELLEKEWTASFQESRDELRVQAAQNIAKIQGENKRGFDKKRKEAHLYREGDLVAVKRTQQAPGSKFASKYLGPYEVTRVLRNNRYLVHKVGEQEGPRQTSTTADFMKPWITEESDFEAEKEDDVLESEDDEDIRGRMSM